MNTDSIAAVATAAGAGGIGIVRVSGQNAKKILNQFFITRNSGIENRRAMFGKVVNRNGDLLDQGIGIFFKGPASYTGEDVVEFQVHGAPFVLAEILREIVSTGLARMAEPGEFTRRAFMAGKLDLTDVERLNLLLDTETALQERVVRELEKGKLSALLRDIRESLVTASASVEARLEYPEDEETNDAVREAQKIVAHVVEELGRLSETYRHVVHWAQGVRIVLAGPPNSGKSSLLNALAGYERSIVTKVAGTTRDSVEIEVDIEGLRCVLVDTAGLRKSRGQVEALGVARARAEIGRADLIIALNHGNKDLRQERSFRESDAGIPILHIRSKSDLIRSRQSGSVYVSSKTGEGIEALRQRIRSQFDDVDLSEAFLFTERQKQAVAEAQEHTRLAYEMMGTERAVDLVVGYLDAARQELDAVVGVVTSDEILDNIFCNFCLGK